MNVPLRRTPLSNMEDPVTDTANRTGPPDINRDGVMVPFWATLIQTLAMAAFAAGALYWSFVIVTSSYNQGFKDGYGYGHSAGAGAVRTKIRTRILPQPSADKADQPPG